MVYFHFSDAIIQRSGQASAPGAGLKLTFSRLSNVGKRAVRFYGNPEFEVSCSRHMEQKGI